MKNKLFVLVALLVVIGIFAVAKMFANPQPKAEEVFRVSETYLIRPTSFSVGAANAPVTIVEFFDPECEACRAMHPVMKRLLTEYAGKLRLVYRYKPLHPNSIYAASVLEEAKAEGKYEEALDILFEKQPEWGGHDRPRPDLIPSYLAPLGISTDRLKEASVIEKHKATLDQDQADSAALMVQQTPTYFVNRRPLFDIGYDAIKTAIDRELAGK